MVGTSINRYVPIQSHPESRWVGCQILCKEKRELARHRNAPMGIHFQEAHERTLRVTGASASGETMCVCPARVLRCACGMALASASAASCVNARLASLSSTTAGIVAALAASTGSESHCRLLFAANLEKTMVKGNIITGRYFIHALFRRDRQKFLSYSLGFFIASHSCTCAVYSALLLFLFSHLWPDASLFFFGYPPAHGVEKHPAWRSAP